VPLAADDLTGIEYVHHTFYRNGFAVRPSPTYAELMTQTDGAGVNRSYLATEDRFALLKELEPRTSSFLSSETSAARRPSRGRSVFEGARHDGDRLLPVQCRAYLYQKQERRSAGRRVVPLDAASTSFAHHLETGADSCRASAA